MDLWVAGFSDGHRARRKPSHLSEVASKLNVQPVRLQDLRALSGYIALSYNREIADRLAVDA